MTTISSGISSMNSNWGGMAPPRMEGRGGGQKPSFSSIDTDGSGSLNKSELTAMIEKGPGGTQASSGSSQISTDDLFAKLDADGDGSVTQSELDEGMKPPGQDSQNAFGAMGMDTQSFASMMGGAMNGIGGMPPPPPPSGDGGMSLSKLDSDEDGTITKTEFGLSSDGTSSTSEADDAQQSLFKLIDSDQSGDLSSSEVSSFQDKMKALFDTMQKMGSTSSWQSEGNSLSVTA